MKRPQDKVLKDFYSNKTKKQLILGLIKHNDVRYLRILIIAFFISFIDVSHDIW